MEKLSGILPSNPRIATVDLESSKPMRAGAPSFGAPVSQTAVQKAQELASVDRVSLSRAAEEFVARPRDDKKVAEDLERNFFSLKEARNEKQMRGEQGLQDEIAQKGVSLHA